ncbi:hypothetical protein CCOS865_02502 [Pseudomonas reidholzensis]|uniref:DUF6630 domain-containing protein n=1 Tax=Pseudomonas reidholzensis TaxID=1785162 RepID=A0A383RUR0_9PSED|nr:hypothetical protein [Pseudomonas reidholzensis]SYX90236.1 hypothetical protein CCOS865_02502 [Pseudomonas reidholzensis]
MGLFDRLFGGRFTQPPPDETPVSDAAIMRELHPYRPGLKAFTQALLARMSEAERARLVRRVMRCYGHGDEPTSALAEGVLSTEKGQSLDQLALLAVDWRGFDGFEYLAPFLVKASGIDERYVYQHDGTQTMAQVLAGFDRWLSGLGRRFLHLDTGGDEYVGCIVESTQVDNMIVLAQLAGIEAGLEAF